MQVFSEITHAIIQGIFLIIGVALGILLLGILFKKLFSKEFYDPEELKVAFTRYLQRILDEEWYEQYKEVELIVAKLGTGKIPKQIAQYTIKQKRSIKMDDGYGDSRTLRYIRYYIVKGKRNPLQQNKKK